MSTVAMTLAQATAPAAEIEVSAGAWAGFIALVVGLIAIDLLAHRDDHVVGWREALVWTIGWIVLSLLFGVFVWWWLGGDAATQYLTGYVIEKSLSIDNVFVWSVLLTYFAVPRELQHRVLFWGIFGALVLRAIFIFAGIALLNRLEWLTFVFGAFLIFTAVRVALHDGTEIHPERNPLLRFLRRHLRITPDYVGRHFFTRWEGARAVTPLLIVLILVEVTDVIFAVDSIPAILAVSRSTFIVFSSNAFAILGLRSLYFVLAGASDRLVYLDKGIGIVLAFVGVKMIVEHWWHLPNWLSLAVIATVLAITVTISLVRTAKDPTLMKPSPDPSPEH